MYFAGLVGYLMVYIKLAILDLQMSEMQKIHGIGRVLLKPIFCGKQVLRNWSHEMLGVTIKSKI